MCDSPGRDLTAERRSLNRPWRRPSPAAVEWCSPPTTLRDSYSGVFTLRSEAADAVRTHGYFLADDMVQGRVASCSPLLKKQQ